MKFPKKAILLSLLIIYLAVLTQQILIKHYSLDMLIAQLTFSGETPFYINHNFTPFKTIFFYLFLAEINMNIRVENLAGNIIGFIPFGFLLPFLFKDLLSFKKIILLTFCLSLGFEMLQLTFNLGSFDVDDLILNTLGGILGYIPVKLYKKYVRKEELVSY
ncbi:VanZ family protein [Planococcus sp. X10-3]|uniref:VanZ family protein n=1 Tax=Planococcus sp. X10-3 TaxID=3061240 RepID=UPI003BAF4607